MVKSQNGHINCDYTYIASKSCSVICTSEEDIVYIYTCMREMGLVVTHIVETGAIVGTRIGVAGAS